MNVTALWLALSLAAGFPTTAGSQEVGDPALRATVERFFSTQEAEDLEGYLSLWSKTAQRPQPAQLKFIFDSGDDTYSAITIVSARPIGDRVRVRVSATRERVSAPRVPGGSPFRSRVTSDWALVFVREGDEWKLVREGPAVDALAESLLEAATPDERDQLLTAEPDLVTDALVMALSRRAGQAAQMSAYPAAQAGFERMRDIARRIGNQKLEGEALQNLANALYFQRNLQGALDAYEQRLAIERSREDENGIASALLGVATVRYTFAEYAAALTSYREALAIQERLGDEGVIATTLISTGNVLYVQGDFPGAIADYTRSRDICRRTLNTAGEADALEGMGRVFLAQGDYAAALDAFAGVLAEAKARNHRRDQGTALLSIGDVHFRLGNLDSARSTLNESRLHFEAVKDLANAGRAWQAIALTDLVASRFGPAEDGYRKSSGICSTADDAECVSSATVGLAFAQTQQDKFEEAIASYKKAIEAFAVLKRREQGARAEVGLSQAFAGSGSHMAAADAAIRARREAEALANDDVLWRALVAEATALRSLREGAKAMAAAEAAVTAVDRLLETAKVRPSAPVARDAASAFAMLALLQAEAGDAAAAFESAERMRAFDLRVILAPMERDINRGMTDAEREEERALATELVSLHAQATRERGLPRPDAARIARLEKSIAVATATRTAQQQRLFDRLPDLRIWRGLMPPASRTDIAALVPDANTALVQFVVGDRMLMYLVARRDESGVRFTSHFESASRRVLAGRVSKLMQPSTLKDSAAWTLAAAELVPGLAAVFGGVERLIVIPHEVLWRVPFEALPVERGYLADTTTVVYAPSVTALVKTPPQASTPVAAAEQSTAADRKLLVTVAAPELAPAVVERTAQTAPGWALRTAERAGQEVKTILAAADAERALLIEGTGATEAALRERLPSADVIHLAGPFRINGASPLFSPLLLAPQSGADGALEVREIMNLELTARAAVVSDGAAMSMWDAADEVPAVAWAWRAAGVPAVLLSRWAADDKPSDELLADLHRQLRTGPADAALRAAGTKVRSRDATAAPFFWAGWVLVIVKF
jgi:tetratricopeptide (TPR) repeat protein